MGGYVNAPEGAFRPKALPEPNVTPHAPDAVPFARVPFARVPITRVPFAPVPLTWVPLLPWKKPAAHLALSDVNSSESQ